MLWFPFWQKDTGFDIQYWCVWFAWFIKSTQSDVLHSHQLNNPQNEDSNMSSFTIKQLCIKLAKLKKGATTHISFTLRNKRKITECVYVHKYLHILSNFKAFLWCRFIVTNKCRKTFWQCLTEPWWNTLSIASLQSSLLQFDAACSSLLDSLHITKLSLLSPAITEIQLYKTALHTLSLISCQCTVSGHTDPEDCFI